MGYFLDKAIFGKDVADTIAATKFAIACFCFAAASIFGFVGICYWIYQEIVLELRYQRQYGAGWQAEFEKYHGTLSHAHTQLTEVSLCMIGVVLVLAWASWRMFHKHKHTKLNTV